MRDINLTIRDKFGNVSFGITEVAENSGIETVIQKVTTLFLSKNKTTYFGSIPGCDILSVGKFNFNSGDTSEFILSIADNINSIQKSIQSDEVTYNIPFVDRLKSISIYDIVYDSVTTNVKLSLLISTNSASKIVNLPVKT